MRSVAVFVAVMALLAASVAKDQFQAQDFVKQHLTSIGTDQARADLKSRVVEGTVVFRVVNQAGELTGKLQFVSEDAKFVSMLKLPNPDYPGERFVTDGNKTYVAQMRPGVYSELGRFVWVHNEILTEGLWGGALNTAWALAHLDERRAKLQDRGMKTMDGRKLRRVDYVPKKRSDLQIELYFEPETLRHVMTVYSFTVSPGMAESVGASALTTDTHYRLEERFADFKSTDNLTLPAKWTIQYTMDVSGGTVAGPPGAATKISQFEITDTKIMSNVSLDPKNFEIK